MAMHYTHQLLQRNGLQNFFGVENTSGAIHFRNHPSVANVFKARKQLMEGVVRCGGLRRVG